MAIEIFTVVVLVAILWLLAARFGADSRDGRDWQGRCHLRGGWGASCGCWRPGAAPTAATGATGRRGPIGGSPEMNSFFYEGVARERIHDIERQAELRGRVGR